MVINSGSSSSAQAQAASRARSASRKRKATVIDEALKRQQYKGNKSVYPTEDDSDLEIVEAAEEDDDEGDDLASQKDSSLKRVRDGVDFPSQSFPFPFLKSLLHPNLALPQRSTHQWRKLRLSRQVEPRCPRAMIHGTTQ